MENYDNLIKKIKELIFYLDDIQGNKLNKEIKKNHLVDVDSNPETNSAYFALQFLIIPFLEIGQIVNLFKNNLTVGISIDDLDLTERINKKLLDTPDIDERDSIKKEIKQALLANSERITEPVIVGTNRTLNTVASWVVDYLSNVGSQETGLGRAKYLYERSYYKNLSEDKKTVLKKLFFLYDFLNRSSRTPFGYEDDLLLMTEDGKLVTTDKGEVIVLYDTVSGKAFRPEEKKVRRVSGPPQTPEEKTIDQLVAKKQELGESNLAGKVVEEEIGNTKKVEELKIMLNKYKDNSLQKRAIEEEIRKLGGKYK